MKKTEATLECPSCQGQGRIPLPKHLSELLPILRSHPDSTVDQVWAKQKDDVSPSAIANRLHDLVEFGLVARRRVGKFFHYTLTK